MLTQIEAQGAKPALIGMLPWKWNHPEARVLKPWARIVVTVWVLVVVPVLVASLAAAVYALPRLMGTAWASLNKQQDVLAEHEHAREPVVWREAGGSRVGIIG